MHSSYCTCKWYATFKISALLWKNASLEHFFIGNTRTGYSADTAHCPKRNKHMKLAYHLSEEKLTKNILLLFEESNKAFADSHRPKPSSSTASLFSTLQSHQWRKGRCHISTVAKTWRSSKFLQNRVSKCLFVRWTKLCSEVSSSTLPAV